MASFVRKIERFSGETDKRRFSLTYSEAEENEDEVSQHRDRFAIANIDQALEMAAWLLELVQDMRREANESRK